MFLIFETGCYGNYLEDFMFSKEEQEQSNENQVVFYEQVAEKLEDIKVWAAAACDLEPDTNLLWGDFSSTELFEVVKP